MKYLLLFPALIFLGAGCTASTTVDTTANTNTSLESTPSTQSDTADREGGEEAVEEFLSEDTAVSAEVTTESEMTVTTDDGTTIVFDTETDTDAEVDEEVPVVDVVLGGATVQVNLESTNFSFTPNTIEAKAGEKIKMTFEKNSGFHTFVIDELGLKHAIKQGESLSFTAPSTPGSYPFYCDIGSHRAQGMAGTLVVK